MSFSRFHDDPARIRKQLDESTFAGRYFLNTPGPGISMPFYEDPQLRLQKWGANLTTNTVNLESDFMGLTRPLNRDLIQYRDSAVQTTPLVYQSEDPTVEESRVSHPAWMYRDLEQTRWEMPWINPQANVEKRFPNNIQTRILEKDYFQPRMPVLSSQSTSFN